MSIRPILSPLSPRPTNSHSHVSRLRIAILGFSLLASAAVARTQQPAADLYSDRALAANAPAYHALEEGRVEDATGMLLTTLAADPADSTAHQLLCRVYYAEDKADDAVKQCEAAASAQAIGNLLASDNHLWLGRACGLKARHAGPIAGFTLARKVQASFSRAVQLNPNNLAALNDLGEYYVAAPSIVGGGDDKADALAAQMMPRYPASAHRLLARLADSNKDLDTAEAEFKRAITAQPSAENWIDLAHFYSDHERADETLAAIKSGLALDRSHGPVLVDAASILTKVNRAPDLAERCLRDYLASRAKSDAAPAFKVHLQLGKLLEARGDHQDANRELEAAVQLAPSFARHAKTAQGD